MTLYSLPYHLDERIEDFEVLLTPDITIDGPLEGETVWDRLAHLYRRTATQIAATSRRGQVPLIMSGDCTTSYATVAGLQQAGIDPGVVWFDAHGDINTLESSASGYIGGMPLRFLGGYRPDLVNDPLGITAIDESRIVLVGARELDPPEVEFLASSPIRQIAVEDLTETDIPNHPIYLHVDFDVVNPDDISGLLYPATGGPSITAVAAAVGRVIGTGRVAGVGLACTWRAGNGAAERIRPAIAPLLSDIGYRRS